MKNMFHFSGPWAKFQDEKTVSKPSEVCSLFCLNFDDFNSLKIVKNNYQNWKISCVIIKLFCFDHRNNKRY